MNDPTKTSIAVLISVFLVIGVIFLVVSSEKVKADELGNNTQVNDSGAYSYGSLSNYQINNNSEAYNQVGAARCAAPSVDMGLTGPKGTGNDSMVYMSINIPLSTGTCRDAQEQELGMMEYQLHVTKVEQRKKDILFQEKMAVVCNELHKTVLIHDPENILYKECLPYEPTHGHAPKVKHEQHVRVSPHE